MPKTLPQPELVSAFNTVETRMAKASVGSQSLSIGLSAIVKAALMEHYGSLKCAAISLGMDLGQLSVELKHGDFKLKRLDVDPDARLFVVSALYEAVRDDDPQIRKQRLVRNLRRAVDDLVEAI